MTDPKVCNMSNYAVLKMFPSNRKISQDVVIIMEKPENLLGGAPQLAKQT